MPRQPRSAKQALSEIDPANAAVGPIPEANQPGHHPPVEQDKPTGPPPRPRAWPAGERRFAFAFEPAVVPAAAFVGVTPWTASVTVTDADLEIRFGLWHLTTSLDNVADAEVTGPYSWLKVAGPPHLSLRDRGITFATTTQEGVCIRLHEPVAGIEPTGRLRHPGITVTVDDAEQLASLLRDRAGRAVAA
ncbi:MAG: hypothetical protein JWN46_1269 [Acidimicrobiales bacterium]|nr:hypothetical protein [Acidimicrobiales bacterium]